MATVYIPDKLAEILIRHFKENSLVQIITQIVKEYIEAKGWKE